MSFIQSASAASPNDGSSHSTLTVTLPSPVGAGHQLLIVGGVFFRLGAGVLHTLAFSDSLGNPITDLYTTPSGSIRSIYKASMVPDSAGGSDTITITVSPAVPSGFRIVLFVAEHTGLTAALDAAQFTQQSALGPQTTTSAITTSNPDDLLVALAVQYTDHYYDVNGSVSLAIRETLELGPQVFGNIEAELCDGISSLGPDSYSANIQSDRLGVFDLAWTDLLLLSFGATPASTLTPIGHGLNANHYSPVSASQGSKSAPGNGVLLGDIEPMRSWCRANGISVALCQDSQRSGKDMLDELLTVGNSAPVYSGDKLKIIPYDEVSAAGHGAIYNAPTAAGPIADLDDKDFALDAKGDTAPLKFTRKRRADCDNVASIEYIDRSLDYAHNVISECDQKAVALYGPRKGGTLASAELGANIPSGSKSLLSISTAPVAQAVASILAKRSAAGVNQYSFTLKPEWMHLEAMDFVTITDKRLGLLQVPVRLTSVKETSKRTLDCLAEEFIYGLNHPSVGAVTHATGTLVKSNVDPGLVNAPIIFQPPAGMLPAGANPQVWMLVSGEDPNYGGCVAFVSLDGGSTYAALGRIGPATTGVLTGDFANHADPDTADTLAVDLTESGGELSAQSVAVADGFADPCYVAGASAPAFEAVCPTDATLTSANHYSLGTYIRRAVLGTAAMDHPTSSRFGVLDGATFKVDLPAQWIGVVLYLKFAAFNKTGGQQNNLADCTAYTFTPTASFAPGGFYVNGS